MDWSNDTEWNTSKKKKNMKSTSDIEGNKNRNYRLGTITVLCSFE